MGDTPKAAGEQKRTWEDSFNVERRRRPEVEDSSSSLPTDQVTKIKLKVKD